jgi:hypothetical protein
LPILTPDYRITLRHFQWKKHPLGSNEKKKHSRQLGTITAQSECGSILKDASNNPPTIYPYFSLQQQTQVRETAYATEYLHPNHTTTKLSTKESHPLEASQAYAWISQNPTPRKIPPQKKHPSTTHSPITTRKTP